MSQRSDFDDPVNSTKKWRYQKVYCDQVYDQRFLSLRRPSQHAYFLLTAHPAMNTLGAIRMSAAMAAVEWRWPLLDARAAFRGLRQEDYIEWNERAGYVAFPRWIERNGAWSANAVTAWPSILDSLPECEEKSLLRARALEHLEGLSLAVKRGVGPAVWTKLGVSRPCEPGGETPVRTPVPTPARTNTRSETEPGSEPGSEPRSERAARALPGGAEVDEVLRGVGRLGQWERDNVPDICEAVRAGRASEKQLDHFRGALRKVRAAAKRWDLPGASTITGERRDGR